MKIQLTPILISTLVVAAAAAIGAEPPKKSTTSNAIPDPRHISNGWNIPSEGYADQPYIVTTDDGAWLCVMTTGVGVEGAGGQHVVSMRSTDRGRTWEKIVSIEPADGPEASYAVLLKVPYGRVYAFYNHNTDRVREVKREDKGVYKRVDSLGHYVFKYSDDHGRSWSAKRYDVPLREFECDRNNVYGGKLRFFWNVGRPLILGDAAVMVMHKVGAMGQGFFAQSEGAFFKSKNILTERDPEKITFETLPDGDIGLRTPPGGGRVAEEQSIVKLSDGALYCVYRTVDGWPTSAYSRDGGHTWTQPAYKTYTPGGRRVKHPRAANFAWNCSNGKFLYWFHNHGGPSIGKMAADFSGRTGSPYDDRNPAWLMAGVERDTPQGKVIHWSQPEILLYDDDPYIRMSYPDLVEDGGKFYVTETQKNVGRVHEIPAVLVNGLFNQFANKTIATNSLSLNLPADKPMPKEAPMPKLPVLNFRDTKRADHGCKDARAGFSFDFWLQLDSLKPGQALLDSRDESGKGILVSTTDTGTIQITLNDGRTESSWDCDKGVVKSGKPQHVVITVDGGPKIITFVVNGILCDGGNERQFGWGRFSPNLRTPAGAATLKIAPAVRSLRVYNRALRTSEAVGHWRAGKK
ncbi:MAG: LamG-like jellyroll fold domain-containing protein [Verrucomicrobiia bacterium]